MAKKDDFYDDGRTVVDMSGVEHQPLFIPRLPKKKKDQPESDGWQAREESSSEKMSREDRKAYFFGAMGAALLVAGIFILAAFLFICFFLFVYNR
jgi:hypothetical protein